MPLKLVHDTLRSKSQILLIKMTLTRASHSEIEQQPDQRGAIQYQERYENDMQEAIVALSKYPHVVERTFD